MRMKMLGGACALALAGPAMAQDSGDGATSPLNALEDIVVTAARRSENVQDVPAAISVLGGADLREANVFSARDVAQIVPNLIVNPSFNISSPRIYIRGIGATDVNANSSSPVATYVDEVFQASPASTQFQLYDVERVEVLRGPQGSLYGRNTTAGAINYISRLPSFDAFEGFATARYGNFDAYGFEGAISVPVVADKLAVRLSGIATGRRALTFNRVTQDYGKPDRTWAARAIVQWEPTEALAFTANFHGGSASADFTGQAFGTRQGAARCAPALINANVCSNVLGYRDTDGDLFAGDYSPNQARETVDNYGLSLHAVADLGFASLTSITAYENVDRDNPLSDNDASPLEILSLGFSNKSWQFSQELRLTSPGEGERFNWIVGAFYIEDTVDAFNTADAFRQLRPTPTTGFNPARFIFFGEQTFTQTTEAWAAFGRVDYEIAPGLKATLGLRYTRERRDFETVIGFREAVLPGGFLPIVGTPAAPLTRSLTNGKFSGDLVLDYRFNYDVLGYASIARGFKSGGFNGGFSTSPAEVTVYQPETLTSYEVGLKSTLFDRALRLNFAAFYYDYQDLQVSALQNSSSGIPQQRFFNAGAANIYGFEAEFRANATPELELRGSLGLLHTEITEFDGSYTDELGNVLSPVGNRLGGAPVATANVGFNYTLAVGNRQQVRFGGSATYQSDSFINFENQESLRRDAFILIDARVSYGDRDDKWTVSLFGRNLSNERYFRAIQNLGQFGVQVRYIGDPATYGIEVSTRF